MEFKPVFDYHGLDKKGFIGLYDITKATFHNWVNNGISLNGQLKVEILTSGKFKASQRALKRG